MPNICKKRYVKRANFNRVFPTTAHAALNRFMHGTLQLLSGYVIRAKL